jgi:pimeloyl-ACP methyl ester carboxylesterase
MSVIETSEFVLNSKHNKKPIAVDVRWVRSQNLRPVVIFIHGFKGYKDWGTYNLMADFFAMNGFNFLKFNLSHNGTNLANPTEFVDLEAFAKNNLSIELDDIGTVIDNLFSGKSLVNKPDLNKVYLIGHSRGGGLAILKAFEDERVKKVVTWASIPNLESILPIKHLEEWKKNGVLYIENSRTKQKMPLNYQLIEDYENNKQRLDIQNAAKNLKKPLLMVHGKKDKTVPFSSAQALQQLNPQNPLMVVEKADHTFGAKEPYLKNTLPTDFVRVLERTIGFLQG